VAAPLLTAMLAVAAVPWGRVPVAKVEVEAPGVPAVYRLRHIFDVAEGSVLSRSEIRAGVQALMATGRVEDVVVDVGETAEGAIINVRIEPASLVRSLTIVGLPHAQEKSVRTSLGLTEGTPLKVAAFEAALDRARRRLADDGYPAAKLDPDLRFVQEDAEVVVTVRGDLGPPVTAYEISAADSGIRPAELWSVGDLSPGQRLTTAKLEAARRRLAEHLRRNGYWEAVVDTPLEQEGAQGAAVSFAVQRGPHYTLDLEGMKLSRALEADALPFIRGEEPFSEAAIDSVVRRVRIFLQRDGHLLAKVSGNVVEKGGERVLRLEVDEGPRTAIEAVRFPGLHSVPVGQLRDRVGVRPGHYWRWGGEPVDDDSLQADATSVLATLQEAGFADATVGDPRVVPADGEVIVEFPIDEGARKTVASLDVEGVPAGVKVPKLLLRKGGPWSQGAEDTAQGTLERALQDAGYPNARVTVAHTWTGDQASVVLKSDPGEHAVVGRVVVAGLVKTSQSAVLKVAGLQTGEVAGPDALLAAQRRLLALGIFERASVHPIPGQTTGSRRGLVLDLTEGPSGAYGFGLGWDTEQRERVSFSWSQLNLFGTARSLGFDARVSSTEKTFQLTYREPPRLGLLGIPTWVSIYRTQQKLTSYDVLQRGMWVEFGDRQRRPFRALLRYDYQIVENTAPQSIQSELERSQTTLHIASLTPTVEWDTRDDVFSPHRGVYASLTWQDAFRVFNADATFDKLTASLASFVPAQGGVLAFSLQGGAIEPHGGAAGAPDNLRVPINVRFYGGGRISQRAFPLDRLGILFQTIDCERAGSGSASDPCKDPIKVIPEGGAGLLLTSLEWRFPVIGVVGGTVFVDGGNVWPAWRDVRPSALRWGAGLGVRVRTPVGPIRLEYAWKFERLTYRFENTEDGIPRTVNESPGELFLSFGNAF
jgi:outer membrane protein insertion porin family